MPQTTEETIVLMLRRDRRTQQWLAERTALAPQRISLLLNGRSRMYFDEAQRIADALSTTLDTLAGRDAAQGAA